MSVELQSLREWIGRTESRTDFIAAAPLAAMSATLDREDSVPQDGSGVPALWHWIFFTPLTRARDIGPDGHAKRGDFLPPVPLPRRMWAGSRIVFHRPLQVGEVARRVSRIVGVDEKRGRSGTLVFVTAQHEISGERGVCITEDHDIVYRENPAPDAPAPAPPMASVDEAFSRGIVPDPVLLFRYSALTFNGHRIHYDRSYVTGVEGYPGLVVHGPLIATLLLDLLRRERPQARVRRFEFKAISPLFDIDRFEVCGRPDGEHAFALWARNHQGALAMQARAETA